MTTEELENFMRINRFLKTFDYSFVVNEFTLFDFLYIEPVVFICIGIKPFERKLQ